VWPISPAPRPWPTSGAPSMTRPPPTPLPTVM
jgi:hypothetical protein